MGIGRSGLNDAHLRGRLCVTLRRVTPDRSDDDYEATDEGLLAER